MRNALEMSDADIMNMTAPPAPAASAAEGVQEGAGQEQTNEEEVNTSDVDESARLAQEEADEAARVAAEAEESASKAKDGEDNAEGGDNTQNGGTVDTTDGEQVGNQGEVTDDGSAGTQKPEEAKAGTEQIHTPDYKAFHDAALAPLKANGKTVEIKSPEDLRQLAQMGLNYTQKMQAIAPIRKVGMMLQDHGLLDESKLSFLIDLHNKKPEAIRQLIKDAGIDPLEIDTSADTGYTPSNHAISSNEVVFRTKITDIRSMDGGQETIDTINSTWDDASKQELWSKPEVLDIMHQHRTNGIYARVAGEVDRLKALGHIPENVSYLQAYQAVGADMGSKGLLNDLVPAAKPAPVVEQKQPIATKVVTKKPDASSAKVAAASQTSTTAKKAETKINPLDLSDDAFEAELKKVRGY